jgi:hypothetical protein
MIRLNRTLLKMVPAWRCRCRIAWQIGIALERSRDFQDASKGHRGYLPALLAPSSSSKGLGCQVAT